MQNLVLILFLFCASLAQADDNSTIEKRLEILEEKAEQAERGFSSNDRSIHSYLNTNIKLGGFAETAISGLFEPEVGPQVASTENLLGINIGAEFSDNLRFVSQFLTAIALPLSNANNDYRGASVGQASRREFKDFAVGTLPTQAHLEWESSEAFKLQAGLGYAPFGITFQQLELVLFVRRGGPQLLRASELVFPLWEGVHVHGHFASRNRRWGYNVYSFSNATHPKMLGVGERLWWQSRDAGLDFGVSAQTAGRGADTYTTVGPDFRLHWNRFTLTSELAKSYGKGAQPWSAHIEPNFSFFKQSVILYACADYFDNPRNKTGVLAATALADPIKKWEYGTGINWLPTSFTRLRFGLTYNKYVGPNAKSNGLSRNYWLADLSAGVAF